MSIKTSKRIALGVIASLVFAPFAAIAPASAAVAVATIDNTTLAFSGRIGNQVSISVTGDADSVDAGAAGVKHTMKFAAAVISQPNGSAVLPTLEDDATTGLVDGDWDDAGVDAAATAASAAELVYTQTNAATATGAVSDVVFGTLGLIPTHVGTYKIRVWNETNASATALSGSESYKDFTITVTDAPSRVTLTAFNTTSVVDGADGALLKVALTDAAGSPAILIPGEAVEITPSGTGIVAKINGSGVNDAAEGTAYLLSTANFDSATGASYVNITSDTASTSISVSATFGVQSSIVNLTFRTLTDSTAILAFADPAVGYDDDAAADTTDVPIGVVSTTFRVTAADDTYSATTAKYLGAKITDTNGGITGYNDTVLDYDVAATLASTDRVSFTVSTSSLAAEVLYTIAALEDDGTTVVEDRDVSSVAATANDPVATPDLVRAAPGATVSITVNLTDNFGRNYANQAISASVAGRNTVALSSKVTDSSGNVVFTFTDTSTSTTLLTDTISISGPNNGSETATISYNSAFVPTTITLGGGNNSATGVALATPQYKDIDAGVDGAQGGVQSISATLKDANGTVMAGVPVSWTVSDAGTKANILSTTAITYTNTNGVASTSVYAWVNGTYTVTATAGSLTATVTIDFLQETAAEARTIAAIASGGVVTATVKDRFGNPVPGVTVWASAPGAAYFGTGTKLANVDTDSAGNAVFVVAGADATITVTTYNPGLTVTNGNGLKGSGQTCAAVDKVNCAAVATSFTEFTAGTTSVAEEGVGASLAAAGVSSATAAVTGLTPAEVVAPAEKPTLEVVKSGGRIYLSGTAADGEGDIIIYVKRIGTSAWKERAKTLEVAAPGDFNGSIKAPKNNVVIRVKQEGTGLFSNQVIALR